MKVLTSLNHRNSFTISFLISSQPNPTGWELNEFNPFFNYRTRNSLNKMQADYVTVFVAGQRLIVDNDGNQDSRLYIQKILNFL